MATINPGGGGTAEAGGEARLGGGGRGGSESTETHGETGGETVTQTDTHEVPQSLYPLRVGNTWTYDVQSFGYAGCSEGEQTASVLRALNVEGREAFEVSSFCPQMGVSQLAAEGDRVQLYYNGDWLLLIDSVLEEGHTWPYYNASFTWEREEEVHVLAGTFTDCWTARQNGSYDAFTTYCRGVGVVHSHSRDMEGSGWEAVLTAKNF